MTLNITYIRLIFQLIVIYGRRKGVHFSFVIATMAAHEVVTFIAATLRLLTTGARRRCASTTDGAFILLGKIEDILLHKIAKYVNIFSTSIQKLKMGIHMAIYFIYINVIYINLLFS